MRKKLQIKCEAISIKQRSQSAVINKLKKEKNRSFTKNFTVLRHHRTVIT